MNKTKHKKELNFDVRIRSGDKLVDEIDGDWEKIKKRIDKKYL